MMLWVKEVIAMVQLKVISHGCQCEWSWTHSTQIMADRVQTEAR